MRRFKCITDNEFRKPAAQRSAARLRLVIYSAGTILAVFAVFIIILNFMGLFSKDEREMKSLLELQGKNTASSINAQFNAVEADGLNLSENITSELNSFMISENLEIENLNNRSDLIEMLECRLIPVINSNLQASSATGAFVVFDVTSNTEASGSDRASVYMRRADLNGNNLQDKRIFLFRGSADAGRSSNMQIHNRWDLEFDTSYLTGYGKFMKMDTGRLADACMWTEPFRLKNTWENVMLMCLPVLDRNGATVGICGFELSEMYFRHCYPVTESSYGNLNFSIVPLKGGTIPLSNSLLDLYSDRSGSHEDVLRIRRGTYYNRYMGGVENYIGIHRVIPVKTMTDRRLAAGIFLSEESFRKTVGFKNTKNFIIIVIFVLLIVTMTTILLNRFVSPWAKLMDVIRRDGSLEGITFGNPEVDEIAAYFRDRQYEESCEGKGREFLPPNIKELLENFAMRVNTLTPMERTVLQYYIEGASLSDIAEREFISINTVKKHNTNMNRKLGISNREELMVYIDLFKRCEKLDELEYHRKSSTTG